MDLLEALIDGRKKFDPIPLVQAPFEEIRRETVVALVSPHDLPAELDLLHVLNGSVANRISCPCCDGTGRTGEPMPPMLGGKGKAPARSLSGQRTASQVVWMFEKALSGTGMWACYDAKMTTLLEEAWAEGPGAVVHLTSAVDDFEYVIDLSSLTQTAVTTGEKRAVMRKERGTRELTYVATVPPGAEPGAELILETAQGPMRAKVPANRHPGDQFTIRAPEPYVPGPGVEVHGAFDGNQFKQGTSGTLTLVGMCSILERELGVTGSLTDQVRSACALLGVAAEGLDTPPPRRGSLDAAALSLVKSCIVAIMGQHGLDKAPGTLPGLCAVLERELGVSGSPDHQVCSACDMLGIVSKDLDLLRSRPALRKDNSFKSDHDTERNLTARDGAVSTPGRAVSLGDVGMRDVDSPAALELAHKCVVVIMGEEGLEETTSKIELPQAPLRVRGDAFLDTNGSCDLGCGVIAGTSVYSSASSSGAAATSGAAPSSSDPVKHGRFDREAVPRIIEVTRGASLKPFADMAGGCVSSAPADASADALLNKPKPVPVLSEVQLQRMNTDERIRIVMEATQAEAAYQTSLDKLKASLSQSGSLTSGLANRRRRELLAAATPGTGIEAQVIFDGARMRGQAGRIGREADAESLNLERCAPCNGSGKVSALLSKSQAKAAAQPPEDPDAYACQVCYGDGEYCISRHCTARHFFCSDCIRGTLTAIVEMGQFPAHCPSCRAEEPNGHLASTTITRGKVDAETLSFLQLRGVISATSLFRFNKAAAAAAAAQPTEASTYFACPAGCGEYLLEEHTSYKWEAYTYKLGEIMTITETAKRGDGVIHRKCFSPGCNFMPHTNPADWNGHGEFCCHACMQGGGNHGPRCQRTPSEGAVKERLAVRLGSCPSCASLVCTRCHGQVKAEAIRHHMCAQVSAVTDEATLQLMAKIGKKCPGCGRYMQKTEGCDIMMCGTNAHGRVADALRNGGCAYIWNWSTGRGCDDGHGYHDINGNWVRGKGPTNERQVLVNGGPSA